ncbi:MAG: ribonuclease P protein component [Desulfovibrio sp.]|nr:ribonuclease P protein component [Desulfovibrio sp.]
MQDRPGGDRRFPRLFRLRKRAEFEACYKSGRKYHTPHFLVFVLAFPERGFPRLGLSVSKKVGNAVLRNRLKRVLRTFFRCYFRPSCCLSVSKRAVEHCTADITIVVKKQADATLNLRRTEAELGPLFERIFHSSGLSGLGAQDQGADA